MKRTLFSGLAVAIFLVAAQTACFAAGFALYEFSARGNALGGTLVARADDPAAVAFNPAGITQLPGTWSQAGLSMITPGARLVANVGGTDVSTRVEPNTFYPPHAFLTHQLNDRVWMGVGLTTRFGLGTEYDPDWVGRFNVYNAEIRSFSLNPNLAFKLSDDLSVAVGVEAMYFDFLLEKKLDFTSFGLGEVDAKLAGDSIAYGINLGPITSPRTGSPWAPRTAAP